MSQEEVADFLNVSQSSYARMERGESTSWASRFNKICKVFEIKPEDLVKSEMNSEKNKEPLTEIAIHKVYRKIIRQYELQIKDLKTIIKNLENGKN